jgi:REP element-mobilizing transposase RayT
MSAAQCRVCRQRSAEYVGSAAQSLSAAQRRVCRKYPIAYPAPALPPHCATLVRGYREGHAYGVGSVDVFLIIFTFVKKKMSAYRQILYHIVFRTKRSEQSITPEHAKELYNYIFGIIKKRNCVLFRINGMEDHIHILSDLHPSVALADYIKEIKVASSKWMKESGHFPHFTGWGVKYCALTYAYRDKEMIINYIKNQQEHHRKESFQDEIRRFFKEEGITLDEKWFWEEK